MVRIRSLSATFLASVLAVSVCGGCASGVRRHARDLPTPQQNTAIGPGDIFQVIVVGEKDLPTEYRVQPDGTVDFPYIQRINVAGLEPQQVVDQLKLKLVEAKILTNPQITLSVKQYNSKKVSVIGQVAKPGSVPWNEGMKLVDALSATGGFSSVANSEDVLLTREIGKGKTMTVHVNAEAITDGKLPDIPLQAGDTIKVDARVF
ncbi:MAG: polysaccharide biosynthesis/export family protein [Polyangiaceae bacterium]